MREELTEKMARPTMKLACDKDLTLFQLVQWFDTLNG